LYSDRKVKAKERPGGGDVTKKPKEGNGYGLEREKRKKKDPTSKKQKEVKGRGEWVHEERGTREKKRKQADVSSVGGENKQSEKGKFRQSRKCKKKKRGNGMIWTRRKGGDSQKWMRG